MAVQANLEQGEISPEVVEDLKQHMYTDDTRDEVLDVIQLQQELRNSYPGDGRNPSPPSENTNPPLQRFLEGITFFLEEFSLGSCPLWLEELGNWKEEPKIWLWLTS